MNAEMRTLTELLEPYWVSLVYGRCRPLKVGNKGLSLQRHVALSPPLLLFNNVSYN